MTVAAVSDAGPLIHLAEIESLEQLSVFDTLLVPATVYTTETHGSPRPHSFVIVIIWHISKIFISLDGQR